MPPHRYKDVGLVDYASFVVKGADSSHDPSIEVVCGDSVRKLVSTCLGNH